MQIFVKDVSTNISHAIDISEDFTIQFIINQCIEKFGYISQEFELIGNGVILSASKTLNDYEISKEEIIYLKIKDVPQPNTDDDELFKDLTGMCGKCRII